MKQIFITTNRQKDNISFYENEPAILVTLDKADLPYLKEQEFSAFPAIYVLIGNNKRYIGQTADQAGL